MLKKDKIIFENKATFNFNKELEVKMMISRLNWLRLTELYTFTKVKCLNMKKS